MELLIMTMDMYKIKDFKWKPGIIKFIKYLNDNEYFVFVVSNQSGVGEGFYKEKDVKKLELYITAKISQLWCSY